LKLIFLLLYYFEPERCLAHPPLGRLGRLEMIAFAQTKDGKDALETICSALPMRKAPRANTPIQNSVALSRLAEQQHAQKSGLLLSVVRSDLLVPTRVREVRRRRAPSLPPSFCVRVIGNGTPPSALALSNMNACTTVSELRIAIAQQLGATRISLQLRHRDLETPALDGVTLGQLGLFPKAVERYRNAPFVYAHVHTALSGSVGARLKRAPGSLRKCRASAARRAEERVRATGSKAAIAAARSGAAKDAARRAFPHELKQRDMVAEVIASRDRKVAVLIKSASEQIALLSARSSALHRGVLHDVDLHGDGSHSSGDTDDCPRDSPELHRRR
tara:strand:+ start:226 stop:1221 length:996 start_codon:yes stop_codon:yes gene_type:complete